MARKTKAPLERSEIMRRVKRKDTPQELAVRRLLWSLGARYRLHVKWLPGSPDIVLGRRKLAIFVHGCFWHRHNCHLATTPKSNVEFWSTKFKQNVERDQRKERQLRDAGWEVVTVWQCELENMLELRIRFEAILSK